MSIKLKPLERYVLTEIDYKKIIATFFNDNVHYHDNPICIPAEHNL